MLSLHISAWSFKDVKRWAHDVVVASFPRHAEPHCTQELRASLSAHLVDGRVLLELTEPDWRELVPRLGPRKMLMKDLQARQAGDVPAAAAPFAPKVALASVTPALAHGDPLAQTGASDLDACDDVANGMADAAESKDISPSLSVLLSGRRPNTERQQINFLPDASGIAEPGRKLLGSSLFSHVPVIDYDNYRPDIEPGSSCATVTQKAKYRVKYAMFDLFFIAQTYFRLLGLLDLLQVVLVWVLTTVFWRLQNPKYLLHPGIVITVSVFPIAFAVNAAYQRREAALQLLARLRSCMMNVYLQHRCWADVPGLPEDFVHCSKTVIGCCFEDMRKYLVACNEHDKMQRLLKVYDHITDVCCMALSLQSALRKAHGNRDSFSALLITPSFCFFFTKERP